MELQTEQLKLIPCTEELINKIEPGEYEPGPHIYAYLEGLKKDPSQYGWGVWFVIEKITNRIIGDMGFKGKPQAETVEIGYRIIPEAQNRGYATEAANELIKWAFSFAEVTKILAECEADNHASIRVLEKLQMQRTGQEGKLLKWEMSKRN